MTVDFYESPCCHCERCVMVSKGYPATRYEPAEDPEFACEEDSDNFCTKDGCRNYERKTTEEDYRI